MMLNIFIWAYWTLYNFFSKLSIWIIWPILIGLFIFLLLSLLFSSVQFSHSVVSNSLWHHELQHATPSCPSPTPRVHSDSPPSSPWCHSAISSSVVPFSSCPQSQHQSLFQWVNSSHEVAKVLEFQLWHHSRQRNPRADLIQNGLVGSPCSPRDSQESSPTLQFKSINSSVISFLNSLTHIRSWPLEKP